MIQGIPSSLNIPTSFLAIEQLHVALGVHMYFTCWCFSYLMFVVVHSSSSSSSVKKVALLDHDLLHDVILYTERIYGSSFLNLGREACFNRP